MCKLVGERITKEVSRLLSGSMQRQDVVITGFLFNLLKNNEINLHKNYAKHIIWSIIRVEGVIRAKRDEH